MASRLEWIDEGQRVMLLEHKGQVTSQEIDNAIKEIMVHLQDGPMYFVVDSAGAKIPVNLISLRSLPDFVRHPNNRYVVIVQDTMLVQYIVKLMGGTKTTACKTLEEALAAVQAKLKE